MQSDELLYAFDKFKSIKDYLSGVVSIDNIPKSLKVKHFVIINTDLSTGLGKHWFCLLKIAQNKYEIFDSLGFSEEKQEQFLKYLKFPKRTTLSFKYNISPVQSNESHSCGLFVLYFLCHRLHNLDLKFHDLFNDIFSNDSAENENLVSKFKLTYFPNGFVEN